MIPYVKQDFKFFVANNLRLLVPKVCKTEKKGEMNNNFYQLRSNNNNYGNGVHMYTINGTTNEKCVYSYITAAATGPTHHTYSFYEIITYFNRKNYNNLTTTVQQLQHTTTLLLLYYYCTLLMVPLPYLTVPLISLGTRTGVCRGVRV